MRVVFGNRLLVGLSRLTYSVFLVHFLAAASILSGWPRLTKDNYSIFLVNVAGVRWFLVSLLVAIPFCLFEELFMTVRRLILDSLFAGAKPKEMGKEC